MRLLLLLLLLWLMLWLLLLLLLLHRHLHVTSEVLLLCRHAIRHLHTETSKLGLLLLLPLLLLISLPHAWRRRWLLAHSARLAGVHRALDVLGVAVHTVLERGIVLMPI